MMRCARCASGARPRLPPRWPSAPLRSPAGLHAHPPRDRSAERGEQRDSERRTPDRKSCVCVCVCVRACVRACAFLSGRCRDRHKKHSYISRCARRRASRPGCRWRGAIGRGDCRRAICCRPRACCARCRGPCRRAHGRGDCGGRRRSRRRRRRRCGGGGGERAPRGVGGRGQAREDGPGARVYQTRRVLGRWTSSMRGE